MHFGGWQEFSYKFIGACLMEREVMWVEWTIFKKQLNKKRRVKITVRQMFSNKNNKSTVVATLMYRCIDKMCTVYFWQEPPAHWKIFWNNRGKISKTIRIKIKKSKVPPRFELGSLDSKSRVLTITPWDPS